MSLQDDTSVSGTNFTRNIPTSYLLNRDDYINQRPPGGSSDQFGETVQPLENVQDFLRLQSPSSASSITSSRPLEWDSGADVGYNQLHIVGGNSLDPGMSTIERMALACGTNLLTRSDPEGTTGPSGQSQPLVSSVQYRSRFKNKLGHPNAESSRLGSCVTSDVSPEAASEGVISPIDLPGENIVKLVHTEKSSSVSGSEIHEGSEFFHEECIPEQPFSLQKTKTNYRLKMPLFPEIVSSLPSDMPYEDAVQRLDSDPATLDHLAVKINKPDYEAANEYQTKKLNSIQSESSNLDRIPSQRHKLLSFEKGNNLFLNSINKKMSSSLENVSVVSSEEIHFNGRPTFTGQSSTLPRSQSQINLYDDQLNYRTSEDKNANSYLKYNMALHNLIQYNKSASSSSIATVVQRNRDSPFGNPIYKQESVGTQFHEGNGSSNSGIKSCIGTNFIETPHLTKSVLAQHISKKSNYFMFTTTDNKNQEPGIGSSPLLQTFKIAEENKFKATSHSHNGIPCTGAHKKTPCPVKVNHKPSTENKTHQVNPRVYSLHSNSPISQHPSRPIIQDPNACSLNNNKSVFGTSTIDSVESSAKSGGGWTDKQYSVTVEDRVNSFEYLPGHIYENTERQQPTDSHGTSSISIQNQTSNNETPDDRDKTSDSSVNDSITLEKDVQKGLDIMSDFLKESFANNLGLKKRLIRKFVEKLITKYYTGDKTEPDNNWVTPHNPIERNGRETRRSKVQCEFSSRSERSESTTSSSECFIPKPAAIGTFLPPSLRENSGLAGHTSHSSTSDIGLIRSVEKSPKSYGKPSHSFDIKSHVVKNGSDTKGLVDSLVAATHKAGLKDSEPKEVKPLKENRKIGGSSSKSQGDPTTLREYLNMDRRTQWFWIRSEMQHLINLIELQEKQEELKHGIKGLRSSRERVPRKSILKERNKDRIDGDKVDSSRTSGAHKKSSSLKLQSQQQPTLRTWLEKTVLDSRTINTTTQSNTELEGWTSHHYEMENDENVQSCMKRKIKSRIQKTDKKGLSENQLDKGIYDEPPLNSCMEKPGQTEQSKHPSSLHERHRIPQLDENCFNTDEGITKMNAQTETLESVGVQTSNSVQQLPVVHPNWFSHKQSRPGNHGVCHRCTHTSEKGEQKKMPVGYYITFQPSSREQDMSNTEQQRLLEEVCIPVPMSVPKQRPTRHHQFRPGPDTNENERVRAGADIEGSQSGTVNSQKDRFEEERPYLDSQHPSGAGMLQNYLMLNRPWYVSRAEDRRQCIAQMQYLRELRDHSKRRLLTLTEPTEVPPTTQPQFGVRRVFSQQTMRRQTERKYRQLSEVKQRQQDTKRKEGYRTNRLMATIFNKKLQNRVLKGEVNLSNSVSVISSL